MVFTKKDKNLEGVFSSLLGMAKSWLPLVQDKTREVLNLKLRLNSSL